MFWLDHTCQRTSRPSANQTLPFRLPASALTRTSELSSPRSSTTKSSERSAPKLSRMNPSPSIATAFVEGTTTTLYMYFEQNKEQCEA